MKHIGRQEEIGIAPEVVRGVGETEAEKWLKRVSGMIIPKEEIVIDESMRGVMEESEGARSVKKWFEGEIEGILHIDSLGYLLANVYGDCATTSLGVGAYSQLFTFEQSVEHPTFTIFRKDGSVTQKAYAGGMISTLQINAVPEQFVKFVANIICASEASNSDTVSYDEEFDFIGKDVEIKIADTEAGLSSAVAMPVKSLSVNYDLGAIQEYNLGSYNPNLYNSKMSLEVDVVKAFQDTTFETLYRNNTAKYVKITITGTTAITGSIYPKFELILNKGIVTEWDKSGGAEDLVDETFKIKAFYNATDSKQSKATLVCKTANFIAAS